MHVAVQLLQEALEAIEHGVDRGLIPGEIAADELLIRSRISIFGAPELGDLVKTALDAWPLWLAILERQFTFKLCHRLFHPHGLQCGSGRLSRAAAGGILHCNLLGPERYRQNRTSCQQITQTNPSHGNTF